MKISSSISTLYNENVDLYKLLEKEVDKKMSSLIKKTWHYDGRVKEIESFAQKIETCRFDKNEILHDLFACRIVVDNITEIANIRAIIDKNFIIVKALPNSSSITHKKPEEFPFDDLRLYCKWTDNIKRPDEDIIKDLVFEIQIKTYLQHAWSISTHSMIYKGNEVDWRLNRVAFQIKAILEHAELSIGNAEVLSKTELLPKENYEFSKLNKIHKIMMKYWEQESLPKDLTRLVQNIRKILTDCEIDIGEYSVLLNKSINSDKKISIKNLSPYYATLQLLNDYEEDKLIKFIEKNKKLIYAEELELSERIKIVLSK